MITDTICFKNQGCLLKLRANMRSLSRVQGNFVNCLSGLRIDGRSESGVAQWRFMAIKINNT